MELLFSVEFLWAICLLLSLRLVSSNHRQRRDQDGHRTYLHGSEERQTALCVCVCVCVCVRACVREVTLEKNATSKMSKKEMNTRCFLACDIYKVCQRNKWKFTCQEFSKKDLKSWYLTESHLLGSVSLTECNEMFQLEIRQLYQIKYGVFAVRAVCVWLGGCVTCGSAAQSWSLVLHLPAFGRKTSNQQTAGWESGEKTKKEREMHKDMWGMEEES